MYSGIDLDRLAKSARKRTGLDDFGAGDWRGALSPLLLAAREEARLSAMGEAILRMRVVERLSNRLQIEHWLKAHPEVHDIEIESPLVLATLPRTGQTAAGWILDRDPANRSLLRWFARFPVPPPRSQDLSSDPRIELERDELRLLPQSVLDMHLSDAEEPDECHWLLSNDMKVPHEIYSMRVPSYYRWVRDEADMRTAYRYYAIQLKMLQSTIPGRRWVLKNSPHLLFLDELHEVIPSAIFVQFHRDPLKVLASNCRLAVVLRSLQCDSVDPREVGTAMLELLGDYVDRLLRFRAKGISRPWIDVRFSHFVRDPHATVASVYEAAGIALSDDAKQRMAQWVAEHPRNDLARARAADLAPYGIDPDMARERFSAYVGRFGIEYDGV